jgi:hypothetical protein
MSNYEPKIIKFILKFVWKRPASITGLGQVPKQASKKDTSPEVSFVVFLNIKFTKSSNSCARVV